MVEGLSNFLPDDRGRLASTCGGECRVAAARPDLRNLLIYTQLFGFQMYLPALSM
jgi:hypothetical protein